ncbi:MAG TPA: HEPN domain-containing protein [Dongiaceae bacterium]|nr:HEPN domain-containing protein [Dongiaceae bacterium]
MAVVQEWAEKAENDLKNAAHTLKMGSDCPTDTVCFHAQQCAEKYVKALLVWRGVDFPKTHDLGALVGLLNRRDRPTLDIGEQRKLTRYAMVARYPGWGPISIAEARRAVALARRVRRELRRVLPKDALKRRR